MLLIDDYIHANIQSKTLDELDEYVMLLETHRIKVLLSIVRLIIRFMVHKSLSLFTVGGEVEVYIRQV